MKLFGNLNVRNGRKTFIYTQILDFYFPCNFYATHQNYEILSKSLVPAVQGGSDISGTLSKLHCRINKIF